MDRKMIEAPEWAISQIDDLTEEVKHLRADLLLFEAMQNGLLERIAVAKELQTELDKLRTAALLVFEAWHEWQDDPHPGTLLDLKVAIDDAGELIPPPEKQ